MTLLQFPRKSNQLMAEALMDIALDEKGIRITHPDVQPMETLDTVPEQYPDYADFYLSGEELYQISFPDGRFMEIMQLSGEHPKTVIHRRGNTGSPHPPSAREDRNRLQCAFPHQNGLGCRLSDGGGR